MTAIQSIEIIYSKDITNCLICGCVNESNGNFVKLTNCNHTFHKTILMKYSSKNKMICPDCDEDFYSISFNFAMSFIQGDTIGCMKVLSGNDNIYALGES
jgi:hypothetical protein